MKDKSKAVDLACVASILAGIVCPGLLVFRGLHVIFLVLLCLTLPIFWVMRWKALGLLGGVLFLWLSAHAIGLSSLGPGQTDNKLPAFADMFGGVCAFGYLLPIYALRTATARGRTLESSATARRDSRGATYLGLVVIVMAIVAAEGMLAACWTKLPRHPQHAAIVAIEAAGGRVDVVPSSDGFGVVWHIMFGPSAGDDEMAFLVGFEHLEELDLGESGVGGQALRKLEQLPSLKRLDLSATRTGDADLEHLRRLVSLDALYLNDVPISARGLAYVKALPNLSTLGLYGTEVGDDAVELLAEMPQLEFVNLEATRVTKRGIRRLEEALPRCMIAR